jgi:hypothetical protein
MLRRGVVILPGRYAEVGATDLVVHWPRPTEPYAVDLARFEGIISDTLSRPS